MALKGSGLNTGVEPVFILDRDIPGQSQLKLRPYDICMEASKVIGKESVLGAQNVRGTWRLFCKSREKRLELLVKGISLRGKSVSLFEKNPRSTQDDPSQMVEKITIKDLAITVSNDEVKEYLSAKGVSLTTDVRYGKERDPEGDITPFLNGDRFAYAKAPIQPVLDRFGSIAGTPCRIFHASQQNTCKICNTVGHKALDPACPALVCPNQEIVTVVSFRHPLSNMYMGEQLVYNDVEYKSVEHAYQALKAQNAGLGDLAKEIADAKHAGLAKSLSKEIPNSETWDEKKPLLWKAY